MKPQAKINSDEFLRLLRHTGWSQARTARALEISPGAVSQICNRKTHPRTSTVGLLRRLVDENQTGSSRHPRPLPLEPWEQQLLRDCRQLSAAERRAIGLIVRRMVGRK